ncbi:MAG TPA: ATP-dependent DNA helicase RecG [Thermomicrobiales bacterium]|nr:ATP-dependent DNA helicase RecG [Thermomicrobiales bacterium]
MASRTHQALSPTSRAEQHYEQTLRALRVLWTARDSARPEMREAVAAYRQLIPAAAATHEMQDMLQRSIERLERLPMDLESRRPIVETLAAELKALRPRLGLVEPTGEKGVLNIAAGERRAGRDSPAQNKPRTPSTQERLPIDAAVTELNGVGKKQAAMLDKLGIHTVGDLLRLSPRRYVDYRNPIKIGQHLDFTGHILVRGTVSNIREHRTRKGPSRVTMELSDGTGVLTLTFFSPYIARQVREGSEIYAAGTVEHGYGKLQMVSPEWDLVGGPNVATGHLVPVYPLTKGLYQKNMRRFTRLALDATRPNLVDWLADIHDYIDDAVWQRMPSLEQALEHLHYPPDLHAATAAVRRMTLESLILLQLGLVKRRQEASATPGTAFTFDRDRLDRFIDELPFELTGAQRRSLDQIIADITRPHAMTRLLQGDVGSGKTVVAAAIALVAAASGHQTAVMTPTELLAEQHYRNLTAQYAALHEDEQPSVALLTGSITAKTRRELLTRLAEGEIDVLIGTHALIQDDVEFRALGLVVIDEQHRFGVRQRSTLAAKARGTLPHLLSMTATPIPRTLNLVLYGDMNVSIIDERPPGRIPIETRHYIGSERDRAYAQVREQVAMGHQIFVICPLVEESDTLEAKAAVTEAERLQNEVFPELQVEVLHGRMPSKKKDEVMAAFRDHQFDILVSTSVIEVGIDIPNATVMMIEGADRFGLSQLHQFRGRVGRGGSKSYCLLLADTVTLEGQIRLDTMVATDDGFELAQKDLELRGPGDFLGGTRQSGLPDLGFLVQGFDTRLLDLARSTAEAVLAEHLDITWQAFPHLYPQYRAFWATAGTPDEGKS